MPLATAQTRPPKPTSALTRTPHEPFHDAEQAWLWTCNALRARRDAARCGGNAVKRPCEPDDVLRALDRLYRNRRIDLGHARVLRKWGERQASPDLRRASEHTAAVLWREAMERLDWPLREKGIVQ
ncbi:MAG: hypothetical protein NT133_10700 [Alphaproteobacteria bacterium]|nr:hypothetical protein [Alphaproteobacteria bacterium]